ncbi:MAG: succinate dehydrogenase, cytochrome b556 subunit [Candidatus Zixiibacteriota bacterium]|nr:MAG: succinate dehydrogenase, cytochrome b556 subunit [candidate division Zixibacteria bacterium]
MRIRYVFKGTKEELKLNPNVGTFSWFLHRITGLLLLFYLFTHMWVLGSANKGAEAFNQRLSAVQTPLFHFLEIGLILVIFYHMVNGLSITLMDFANISSKHKSLVVAVVLVFAVLAIVSLSVMLPRIFAPHVPTGGLA